MLNIHHGAIVAWTHSDKTRCYYHLNNKENVKIHRSDKLSLPRLFKVSVRARSTHLDVSVVESLGALIKLHPHSEGQLIIPEGAQCFEIKLVSILDDHFGLGQGDCNFSCSKVNIWGWKRFFLIKIIGQFRTVG